MPDEEEVEGAPVPLVTHLNIILHYIFSNAEDVYQQSANLQL